MATLYAIKVDWPNHPIFLPREQFCNLGMQENETRMTTLEKLYALDRLKWFRQTYPNFTYTLVSIKILKD